MCSQGVIGTASGLSCFIDWLWCRLCCLSSAELTVSSLFHLRFMCLSCIPGLSDMHYDVEFFHLRSCLLVLSCVGHVLVWAVT